MFSSQFLFPAREHDDSLGKLLDTAVQDILKNALNDHHLAEGTLGMVGDVSPTRKPHALHA